MRRSAAASLLTLGLVACAAAVWKGPEGQETPLPEIPGSRLSEITPYLLPAAGALTLFVCHWDPERAIAVALPPDASAAEAHILSVALRAWEDAGLGVHFVPAEPGDGALVFAFATDETADARTVADCRIHKAPAETGDGRVLAAELVRAEVHLPRSTRPDLRGHTRALSESEQTGIALHELGHALGFQGHVQRDSIMARDRDEVTRRGRRVLGGALCDEPTLRALYALPSGTVLSRIAISPFRTESFDALAALAEERAMAGPFVRVGDGEARIFFVTKGEEELGVEILEPARVVKHPQRLALLTEPAARRALESLQHAPGSAAAQR
ncbi:MAG TPA: hypothetical protein VKM54_26820 [Myxococcota bacterium]|nr:hypothetical protein [Myxococcota bacterium]